MGFRELVSYEKLGIVYPYNTVTTLRQTVSKNSELLERVLKTLIEGIAIFKTNKQKSIAVWRKYLRGASEEVMEESYQSTVGEMEQVPLPSLPVIKSGLDILSLEYPQAKQTDANLIIDSSLVRRIEQSGFIDALYKKSRSSRYIRYLDKKLPFGRRASCIPAVADSFYTCRPATRSVHSTPAPSQFHRNAVLP